MAVTVGSVAGSGGRTPTTRPPGSVTTFAATHREALSLATEVPASTYVMVPSESRQPYPEKPAAAYTVESTGQRDSVVWTGVLRPLYAETSENDPPAKLSAGPRGASFRLACEQRKTRHPVISPVANITQV